MRNKVTNKFFNKNLIGSEKKFNDVKLIEMLISVLFIIFGIILLFNKTISDSFISISLGVLVLFEAALNIYSTVMENSNKIFKINIVFGVIEIIIAILLFTNLFKFMNALVIYYSAYLILNGVKDLITAFFYKVIREDSFLIVFTMAILVISLGLLLMFYPFETFGTIEVIAIFSILLGLLNINTSNLLRNRVDKFLSKVDND